MCAEVMELAGRRSQRSGVSMHGSAHRPVRTQLSHMINPVYKPFIPDEQILPEFTLRAVVLGAFLGIVFGASSVYLALKAGQTVSASIPCAVIAAMLFRSKMRSPILECNMVQTI